MRLAAGTILVAGALLAGCTVAPSVTPPSESPPPGPIAEVVTPTGSDPDPLPQPTPEVPYEVQRITPQELKARMDSGESLLVADVRGPGSYDLLHIAGSVSLPAADYLKWAPTLDKQQLIVFY